MLTALHESLAQNYQNVEELKEMITMYKQFLHEEQENISSKQKDYLLNKLNRFSSVQTKLNFVLNAEVTFLCPEIRKPAADFVKNAFGLSIQFTHFIAGVNHVCITYEHLIKIPDEIPKTVLRMISGIPCEDIEAKHGSITYRESAKVILLRQCDYSIIYFPRLDIWAAGNYSTTKIEETSPDFSVIWDYFKHRL